MKKRTIPTDKLQVGMHLCARNIRAYLTDVQLLLDHPHDYGDWHAVVLAILALEELAKYSELKKAKDSAKTDKVEINSRLFYDHEYKQQLARKLIDKECLKLINKESFKLALRIETVEISLPLRLECAFVDWKDGQWVLGTPLIPNNLRKLKDCIAKALQSLE